MYDTRLRSRIPEITYTRPRRKKRLCLAELKKFVAATPDARLALAERTIIRATPPCAR